MPKQVNSFILPDNIIQDMKDKIKETRKKKIELGFSICTEKYSNVIVKGSECVGTKCSIKMGKCKEDQRYIGNYHTHPIGPASLSITDMIAGCSDDMECVGSARFGSIRCFTRRTDTNQCHDEIAPFKEEENNVIERRLKVVSAIKNPIQILRMGVPQFIREFRQHDKDIGEYYTNRLRLLNQNFNKTDIK